jgi:hypothetical protein
MNYGRRRSNEKTHGSLDAKEVIAIRGDAASYARQFLVNKYRENMLSYTLTVATEAYRGRSKQ